MLLWWSITHFMLPRRALELICISRKESKHLPTMLKAKILESREFIKTYFALKPPDFRNKQGIKQSDELSPQGREHSEHSVTQTWSVTRELGILQSRPCLATRQPACRRNPCCSIHAALEPLHLLKHSQRARQFVDGFSC